MKGVINNMVLAAVGGVFLLLGILMKIFPPKKINSILGYRTKLSMKNNDTWNEAQRYGAYSSIVVGVICIVVGICIHVFFKNNENIIGMICFIIVVICDYLVDEHHLRTIFDSNGNRITG